jgi:hypothetical protein
VNVYSPVSFVWTVRVNPVLGAVIVTVALGWMPGWDL